ncbi:MAG: GAF domain-containing protein [Polyangia bacterium]|jgi:signal transduction histidine kinase/putative methionine-R-sulfoxide reductase with GAF domain|nr:GAF domain-containing protein [Polyangia bacterium]
MTTDLKDASSRDCAQAASEARLSRVERELQVVKDVAKALGSTLDLDTLLQIIMAKTMEVMDADRATLYLLDEERGEIWSKVTQGGEIQEIRLRIPEGISGWVAQTGETANIPDAYADPRFNPEVDRKSGYRTRSILTMPMLNNQGKAVGVVQILNRRDGKPFGSEDEELLRALTAQAAVSIENGKLYQSLLRRNAELQETQAKLERRMKELDLLYQIEQERFGADSLDELLDRLVGRAMDLVSARAASVVLVTQDRAELHFGAATGPKGQAIRKLRMPRGKGVVGWVVEHDEPVVLDDASTDPRHNRELAARIGYQPRSILCVPIRGEDGVLGALELLDKGPRANAGGADSQEDGAPGPGGEGEVPAPEVLPFDDNDLKLASLFAGHLARAIQLVGAQEVRLKESRLAAIGQMLSGVVHDLKTPLTIASGYTQLLPTTQSEEQRAAFCQEILKQFELMDSMTREVLAFARGDLQLLIRKVYLHRFLADVGEHLHRELEGKGITLQIEAEYQGLAWFDEIKLRRVVHNLASNAARAMPDGGTFTFRSATLGDSLVLTFSDTGTGIPEELEGRLFELFATSGGAGGTGLGLAIVKRIVTEHGGRIEVESARGEGTTFTVTLPLRRQNEEEQVAEDEL